MWMPQKAGLSVPVGREGVEETGSHQQGAFPTACPMSSVPRARPGTQRNGGLEPWGSALMSVRVLGLSSLGSPGTRIPRQLHCISPGTHVPYQPYCLPGEAAPARGPLTTGEEYRLLAGGAEEAEGVGSALGYEVYVDFCL